MAALAVAVIAASATISLAATAWACALGNVPPDSSAPTLVQVFIGWEGFFSLPLLVAVLALIGGLAWASLLRALDTDHWALYPLGGALIAGVSTAPLFGLPADLPGSGLVAPDRAIETGIILLGGGCGGLMFRIFAGTFGTASCEPAPASHQSS